MLEKLKKIISFSRQTQGEHCVPFLFLNKLLVFIGNSNLYLAFAAFCFTAQGSFIFYNSKESFFLFAIVNFNSAFILYNIQRIFQSFNLKNDERLQWFKENRKYIYLIIIVLGLAFSKLIYTTFIIYKQSIIIYGISGLLSILYFLPPFELRKFVFLKIFIIAFIWVIVCIMIPCMFEGEIFRGFENFNDNKWFYLSAQFCFIAAICIPFDIRDVEKDRISNVGSLPVLIGIKNSKIFSGLLLLAYLILSILNDEKNHILIPIVIAIMSIIIVVFSEPDHHKYYFTYFADGLIILQAILYFLLT